MLLQHATNDVFIVHVLGDQRADALPDFRKDLGAGSADSQLVFKTTQLFGQLVDYVMAVRAHNQPIF